MLKTQLRQKCILQNTHQAVSVSLEVIAHKAVGVLGLVLDVGRGSEVSGVLQEAHGGLLLGLPVAEVGGIMVACGGRGIAGRQGDAELSLGRILDGGYRKTEIRFNPNIHDCRGFMCNILEKEDAKVHFLCIIQGKVVFLHRETNTYIHP